MVASHLKSLPGLRSRSLNEHIEALESFCCHWLLKLQLFCFHRRRKWARKGKKSLDSVFGAYSKQKPCGVLCEIVHFFLLLFNKDVYREFWKGEIDPNPRGLMKWLTFKQSGTNVTSFQPLMKHSTVPSHRIWHTSLSPVHKVLMILPNLSFLFYFVTFQIDHFGFLEDGTFKQRYLVNAKHWQQPGGPIFFYTGNEGDISWFCNNTVNIPPCFSDCMHWKSHLMSVIIFFEGLYVGNCGGIWCLAGFCRTSLLWRVPTIWSWLLQCKWWWII